MKINNYNIIFAFSYQSIDLVYKTNINSTQTIETTVDNMNMIIMDNNHYITKDFLVNSHKQNFIIFIHKIKYFLQKSIIFRNTQY